MKLRFAFALHNYYDLSLDILGRKMLEHFRDCSVDCFLKHFSQFTADRNSSIEAEVFAELSECFFKPVRRFVKDHGSFFVSQFFQHRLSAFLLGKETFECEPVGPEPGLQQRRDECGSTRKAFYQ